MFSNRSVATIVLEQLPYTLALAGTGLGWAVPLGIPLGCHSALHRGSLLDKLSGAVTVGAIPLFVAALYPCCCSRSGSAAARDRCRRARRPAPSSDPAGVRDRARLRGLSRPVRAGVDARGAGREAHPTRARSACSRLIVSRYPLQIAILPTVTLLGVGAGNLLSGAVSADFVFARPGVGKLIYDMAIPRNYPVVHGAVLVTTALSALSALSADLLNASLDPRVRTSLIITRTCR